MWGVVLGFLFSILNNVKKLPTVTPQRARSAYTFNVTVSASQTNFTALNITGTGRLIGLECGSNNVSNIQVIIDGRTVVNVNSPGGGYYLGIDGQFVNANGGPSRLALFSFKTSLQILVSTTSSGSGNVLGTYELE